MYVMCTHLLYNDFPFPCGATEWLASLIGGCDLDFKKPASLLAPVRITFFPMGMQQVAKINKAPIQDSLKAKVTV